MNYNELAQTVEVNKTTVQNYIDIFEIDAFKEILKENQAFSEGFMRLCCEKTIFTFNMFLSLTHKNMESRIAEALFYLNDVFEGNPITGVPKNEIAELVALSKESVIRVFKDWKSEGIVEDNGRGIVLMDKTELQKIALRG